MAGADAQTESTRLDMAIVERGLLSSRTLAQAAIKAGTVTINGAECAKPGMKVAPDDTILVSDAPAYVSRGGLKLEAAIEAFSIDCAGKVCLDVGASTGGFTDCLLQHGAKHVTAIDVGTGQLNEKIAADPRVTSYEKINARTLDENYIAGPFDLIVVDVSFISLKLVIPRITPRLTETGTIITLIKPQFEVGRSNLGAGGIVKSDSLRLSAVESVTAAIESTGLARVHLMQSPIKGGDGNTEFLGVFKRLGA